MGGTAGASYDNAFLETIDALYSAEVIHRRGLEKPRICGASNIGMGFVVQSPSFAGSIGHIPPMEAEANYYRNQREQAMLY